MNGSWLSGLVADKAEAQKRADPFNFEGRMRRLCLGQGGLAIVLTIGLGCGTQNSAAEDEGGMPSLGPKCGALRNLVDSSAILPAGAGATGIQIPTLVATETYIYYEVNLTDLSIPGSSAMMGRIMRVPIRGGESELVAPVVGGSAIGGQTFAVTASNIVFGQVGESEGGNGGAIVSTPLTGGVTKIIASTVGAPGAILSDVDNVYFVDGEGTKRVPRAGGKVATLANATPFSLGLIGTRLILADYYVGNLLSVPTTGGPVTSLATQQKPLYPVGCGPNVCWLNDGDASGSNGSLMELDLDSGGIPTTILTDSRLSEPQDLVFDGNIFFASGGSPVGNLLRVPSTGRPVVQIATWAGLSKVAVDETCVYWSSFGGIFSQAK